MSESGSFLHCRGAADGEGLGNSFLSHIAAVDGIFHVCRAFEDADVVHVEDRVDPVADLEIIHGCEPYCCMSRLLINLH
jgi:ribosome-binding ATPase YchF (GTP1/OBG family)